jgi:hypothetical protein
MTLIQLRAFCSVVEQGSFRAAARALDIAQSTLTQADNTTANDASREDLLVARCNFGYATTYFGFGADREPGTVNFRDFHVGISRTWNVANVMYVAYEYKNDLDGHSKNLSGLIVNYLYYLSKRTNLNVAGITLGNIRYSTTKNGSGSRELAVGICHLF